MRHEIVYNQEESIIIPHPESYKDCITLIRSDYYRPSGESASIFKMWMKTLYDSGWAYLFWLRLTSYKNGLFWPFCRLFLFILSEHTHIHISYKMKIGYGIYIGHGIDMVVNPLGVIGNNVNLSQFLNIGSNTPQAAIIGNNVYIGPHVCIIGSVAIGSNSTIGAGSIVVKDIPKNATAVGNPCKPINFDNPLKWVGNLWSIPQL